MLNRIIRNIIWEDIKKWCVIFALSYLVANIFSEKIEVVFTFIYLISYLLNQINYILNMGKEVIRAIIPKLVIKISLIIFLITIFRGINIYQAIEIIAFASCFDTLAIDWKTIFEDMDIEDNEKNVR